METTDQEAIDAIVAFIQANSDAPGAQFARDAASVIAGNIARRRQYVVDEAASVGMKAR